MALHRGLLVSGALPEDAGSTIPFIPGFPVPVLFTCLPCTTIRAMRTCPCGHAGCGVCHLADCSTAMEILRRDQIRRDDGMLSAPVVTVRRVGLRRA